LFESPAANHTFHLSEARQRKNALYAALICRYKAHVKPVDGWVAVLVRLDTPEDLPASQLSSSTGYLVSWIRLAPSLAVFTFLLGAGD
jgi:hypothetical protein